MAWNGPTLAATRTLLVTSLQARLTLAVPTLRRWLIGIIGTSTADLIYSEHGYLKYIIRQAFASSADRPYLERQGRELGVIPKGAAPSAGSVTFTGIATSPVPLLTLQSNDGTLLFATQATGTITAGVGGAPASVTLPILALTPGAAGNLAAGTQLLLTVAQSGVDATATVALATDGVSGLTGGADLESTSAYRGRVLQRKQNPPQGGARMDYVLWAKTVSQCTRAWSFPRNRGGGTDDVTFVCDGRTSIIPLSADITAVQAAIDPLKPGSVDCAVFACTADAIAVTITNLAPNNSTTQAAVYAQLADLFATTAPGSAMYGDGVSEAVPGGHLLVEQISTAIAAAAGVTGFDLVAPSADISSAFGHLAVLGTVTINGVVVT